MDVAGFVLAGGRSSRMGSEKALVEFAGEPLVVHSLRTLRGAGVTASIAGARSPLERFAPVVADIEPDRGPLGGICAALASTEASCVVFLSVDLPLLPALLVTFLLQEAQDEGIAVTLASVDGFAQTFPAVVRRAALPWLLAALDSGRGGCFAAFQAAAEGMKKSIHVVPIKRVVRAWELALQEELPAQYWFLNINAPADLLQAKACLAERKSQAR